MTLKRLLVLAVAPFALVAALVLPAGPASASTVSECQAALATLRSDTVAHESSFTSTKDFEGLLAKLDAAAAKLDVRKDADAIAKLQDYQTTLTALASADKPKYTDPESAQALVDEAGGVISCIGSISD